MIKKGDILTKKPSYQLLNARFYHTSDVLDAMQEYAEEYHRAELLKLNKSDVRYQLAISALEAIVDPIGHMKKQLEEDERLDGMYAIRIAERPEFYQDIAKKALEEIANCT